MATFNPQQQVREKRQTEERYDASSSSAVPASEAGQKGISTPIQVETHTIFGINTVQPPAPELTLSERKQRADDYGTRVLEQMKDIENGSESQRNLNFLNARPFMRPAGFFSGGLMAAGVDPHEKITVLFTTSVGKGGVAERRTGGHESTYDAWEIAALNFQNMHIKPEDQDKVNTFTALAKTLQKALQTDIMSQMQAENGKFFHRSGKADAFSVRATLQNLKNDNVAFGTLRQEAQQAVQRTLDKNGQVIIPNLYGYPMRGYAFIPS